MPADSFMVSIVLCQQAWVALLSLCQQVPGKLSLIMQVSLDTRELVRRSKWMLSGLKLWCQLSRAP